MKSPILTKSMLIRRPLLMAVAGWLAVSVGGCASKSTTSSEASPSRTPTARDLDAARIQAAQAGRFNAGGANGESMSALEPAVRPTADMPAPSELPARSPMAESPLADDRLSFRLPNPDAPPATQPAATGAADEHVDHTGAASTNSGVANSGAASSGVASTPIDRSTMSAADPTRDVSQLQSAAENAISAAKVAVDLQAAPGADERPAASLQLGEGIPLRETTLSRFRDLVAKNMAGTETDHVVVGISGKDDQRLVGAMTLTKNGNGQWEYSAAAGERSAITQAVRNVKNSPTTRPANTLEQRELVFLADLRVYLIVERDSEGALTIKPTEDIGKWKAGTVLSGAPAIARLEREARSPS